MSPRSDGMPEGHPDRAPLEIATLTLSAVVDDEGTPTSVRGEIALGMVPASMIEEAHKVVVDMMRRVLESQDVTTFAFPVDTSGTCGCGRCSATGGDAS